MERNSPVLLITCLIGLPSLLIISAAAVAGGSKGHNKELNDAWVEMNYRGRKEPEQVYQSLEKVIQLYATLNISDLSSFDQDTKKTYDVLFAAWNQTPDQCTEADFSRRDFFKYYKNFEVNIRNYWEHCEQKRVQLCVPILEEQVRAELDMVDPEAERRRQVKLLVDSVKSECAPLEIYEVTNKYERIEVVEVGTLNYMEALEGPLGKSVLQLRAGSRDRFASVYKRLVGDLCAIVLTVGKKQVEIFQVIKHNIGSWKPADFVREWMDARTICIDIKVFKSEAPILRLLRHRNLGKGLFWLGRHL